MVRIRGALAVALSGLIAGNAAAAPAHVPVQWHIKSAPSKPVKPSGRFDAVLVGQIESGWHLYALEEPEGGPIATEVNLTEGDPAELQRVSEGKPRVVLDPVFQKPTGFFENTAEFTLHAQVARDATAGPHTLHVLVRFQSCSDRVCLPPHTDTVELPITVGK